MTEGHRHIESGRGDFTLVASGDALISQTLSVFKEEPARALFDTFRASDVGFTNLETVVHEYGHTPRCDGRYLHSVPSKETGRPEMGGYKPRIHRKQP